MQKLKLLKQELKPEVVGVETEVNNDADDDEVKEHDGDVEFSDHSESDPDYVYVSPEDCFEVTHW